VVETTLKPASRTKVVASFAAIYLIWGSTYLAIRIGIETVPPFLMAGFRFLGAGVPLYLVLRLRGSERPTRTHWRSAIVLGVLMLALGNGLVTWSERTVASSIAAVIIATVPLWMTMLEVWPFRRASVTAGALAGLALGLAGVVVLVAPTGSHVTAVDPIAGLGLVIAALSWSLGSLLSRSLALPSSPLLLAAMQMTCGGAVLVLWGTLLGEWSGFEPAAVSLRSALAVLYLIAFGSMVALGAYAFLIRVTSAAAVSSYAFVNPVVAVVLGSVFAGEVLGPRALMATVLVIGAVAFLQGTRLLRRAGEARRRRRAVERSAGEDQSPIRWAAGG
jgi:drug/metabolite transporter (DMT)-like permease